MTNIDRRNPTYTGRQSSPGERQKTLSILFSPKKGASTPSGKGFPFFLTPIYSCLLLLLFLSFQSAVAHECEWYVDRSSAPTAKSKKQDDPADTIYRILPHTLREQILAHPEWSVLEHFTHIVYLVEQQRSYLQELLFALESEEHIQVVKMVLDQLILTEADRKEILNLKRLPPFPFSVRRTGSPFANYSEDLFLRISGIIARSRGPLGELKAALQVPYLSASNLHIEEMLGPDELTYLKDLLQEHEFQRFLKFEIDVIYDHGRTWGEVKNRSSYKNKDVMELLEKFRILRTATYHLNRRFRTNYRISIIAPKNSLPDTLVQGLIELNIYSIDLGWPVDLWYPDYRGSERKASVSVHQGKPLKKNRRTKSTGRKKEGHRPHSRQSRAS